MKFAAIPVSQGDTFYAETVGGCRILIDGGRTRHTFPCLKGIPELILPHLRYCGGSAAYLRGVRVHLLPTALRHRPGTTPSAVSVGDDTLSLARR